jgi:D-lactate dehydrogenase
MPLPVAFFDTKPYDRDYFTAAPAGSALDLRFLEHRLGEPTVATAAGAAAVCCFVNDRLDRAVLTRLRESGVRHIALRCAGFNNVDLAAAKELGLAVTRVPAYSPHAVAEHTVALLLTLNRKIHRAHNRVREQNFSLSGLVGFDLHGKTAGVVGTGKIGRITAEKIDLFAQSDVVSLHSPLTPDTHHLVNEPSLAAMKRGAFLVNTSRGKLIDTAALIEALKSGRIGGVALDVYEEEEGVFFEDHSDHVLADDELARLLTFPNVLITAHQAFLTREALAEIARVTTENLQRCAARQPFLDGTQLA